MAINAINPVSAVKPNRILSPLVMNINTRRFLRLNNGKRNLKAVHFVMLAPTI